MSLAILTIIGVGAANFASRFARDSEALAARNSASAEMQELQQRLLRDLKLVRRTAGVPDITMTPAGCTNCSGISITKRAKDASGAYSSSVTTTFITSCQALPTSGPITAFASSLTTVGSSCLPAACTGSTRPVVTITQGTTTRTFPTYVSTTSKSAGMRSSALAMALCVNRTTNEIRVRTESGTININDRISVVGAEVIAPINNMLGEEMLSR